MKHLQGKVIVSLLLVFVAAAVYANYPAGSKVATMRVITDMAGRRVVLPEEIRRAVGIEAGALRLMVYLGAVDKVCGVEDLEKKELTRPYIIAHPELVQLPSIGPKHGGDAELIAAQRPDVIFWTYTNAGNADSLQRRTGIPVVVLNYGDLDDQKEMFYQALRLTAQVLHKQPRAESLIAFIEETRRDLDRRTRYQGRQETVYIGGVAHRGAHGITSTEPTYTPFLYVNAQNVADGIALDHIIIEQEQLIRWNPDKIFIDSSGYSLILDELAEGSPLGDTLSAVQNNDVYRVLPYNWYTTNFETVLANAYFVGKVLYPEAFRDIDPEQQADRIYNFFVAKGVYAEMKKVFGGFARIELR